MATLPSKFVPKVNGLSVTRSRNKRRVQFGEGYVQEAIASTNPTIVTASLDFFIWGDDDLNELQDFVDSLDGDYLQFTLPNETTAHNYTVGALSISYVDSMQRGVSLPIGRVY